MWQYWVSPKKFEHPEITTTVLKCHYNGTNYLRGNVTTNTSFRVIELLPIPLANHSRASYTSIMNPLISIPTSSLRLSFHSSASHSVKRSHADIQASQQQIPWFLAVSFLGLFYAWAYRQPFTPFKIIPRTLHELQTKWIILGLYCWSSEVLFRVYSMGFTAILICKESIWQWSVLIFLTVRLLEGDSLHISAKITSLSLLCAAISATPQFRHPTWRPFRARMFISLGLSALFPVVHGVMKFGIRQMNKQIGLFWVVLQGSLYIVGACIYAVSQETCLANQSLMCKFSDANTRAYTSWQVRYLDKLSPNLSHYGGTGYNISPSRIGQCLWL